MNVMRQAVRRHFTDLMDVRLRSLLSAATCDLHYGPSSVSEDRVDGGYPGYVSALKELETWSQANIVDIYVDLETGDLTDTDPSSGEDPDYSYTILSRSDVARIVFSRLISDGGMSP